MQLKLTARSPALILGKRSKDSLGSYRMGKHHAISCEALVPKSEALLLLGQTVRSDRLNYEYIRLLKKSLFGFIDS